MHYNFFCRVHQTLRASPAMEAEIVDDIWVFNAVVPLLETKGNLAA